MHIVLLQQPDDLIIAEREATELFLGKNQFIILPDIIDTTRGWQDGQCFHSITKFIQDSGNQTGCSR